MVHKPHSREKRSRNGIILAGIIAAVAVSVAYGAVSGSFSSIGPPTSPATVDDQPMVMHNHAKLTIKTNGKSITVPANIGIDDKVYKDHTLDEYGMKMPNMPSMPVMAPLHTHDTSATIHVESTEVRDYTLGDLFNIWGVTFTSTCIMDKCNDGTKTLKMLVNGQPSFEFRNYIMKDGDEIVIEYD